MTSRRSYKTDESFLEKISIGAIGTRRVFDDLFQQGHHPIELERGSTSFKIWKTIKIKRIRVPDILCLHCGRRVESRAKTKLEITMSHSFSNQERGWDYGLEDDDFVALAVCQRVGDRPVDWEAGSLVQYVSVRDLRAAQRAGQTISVEPKGAQEGFEARITWPSSVASSVGTIARITPEYLQYKRQADHRTITLSLSKRALSLRPLVQEGDVVAANQVLASVVSVMTRFPCSTTATEQEYIAQLSSSSLSERYKASKALSYFNSVDSLNALMHKMADDKDHIYVRLEAASSLARRSDERGISFIANCLSDQYLENRLEAVIVLGEIGGQAASRMLMGTLRDDKQHPEIRAGAAWALGELREKSSLGVLIESFAAIEEEIRVEAVRALAKLAKKFTPEIVDEFSRPGQTQRAGMAWALSKSAQFSVEQLRRALLDDDARRWVAYMIGTQDPQSYVGQIELLRQDDAEVYFAVTVLWQIMNSWVYGLEEYG
ncbi:MAG TPA: HEAT repeat domain-containing protein [Anaerolineae bacterium]|nr:HEAT repeat domain-containing protein [Anaerolineae bacterium]HQH38036.1 HEAT repeat domain-containing protein [Anaerolineae bacterium]